jgi:adenylate cyclase
MVDDGYKRKLTAILSADVKGYTRLMGEDEEATINTLTEYRKIISGQVKQHDGRIVDSPGDNVLSEFASVVDAMKCAVDIQKEIAAKNESLPENRKMKFRIGVNLGDVAQEDDRIYGDGVNVAARIESLADPGGICISRSAYDQVRKRLSLGYEYLGEHWVKNIDEPVRVYRVLTAPECAGRVIGEKTAAGKKWRRLAYAAVFCLIVVAGSLIAWNIYLQKSSRVESADIGKMAYPLPDKPSIAVLPFDNMSGDPEQEYFSDGLTEEIITGLSRIPSLFVIARNSSFIYKGKPVKVQRVSEELCVRYVLVGSVRKEGDRVRIAAQLIDAISGYHKWSKRYDRKLENIFDLQEDIMKDLLNEMRVQLIEGERAREWHQEFQEKEVNLEAYEKQMKSRYYFFRMDPEGFARSEQLAKEAIEIAPNYCAPYIMLAYTSLIDRNLPLAEKYALKAFELNDSHPMALITMGQVQLYKREWEAAIALGKRALAVDPNSAEIKNHLGYFLYKAGRPEEAIPLYEKAIRINPYPPSFFYNRLGGAYALVGRYDEAIESCKKGLKKQPSDLSAHFVLAAVYIWQDRREAAQVEVSEILKVFPQCSLRYLKQMLSMKDKEALNRLIEAWRKAGIPEL